MEGGIKYIKLLFVLKTGDFFYFLFNLSLSGLPICQVTNRNPGYGYVTQLMASFLICSMDITGASLHAEELDREVFVKPPKDIRKDGII